MSLTLCQCVVCLNYEVSSSVAFPFQVLLPLLSVETAPDNCILSAILTGRVVMKEAHGMPSLKLKTYWAGSLTVCVLGGDIEICHCHGVFVSLYGCLSPAKLMMSVLQQHVSVNCLFVVPATAQPLTTQQLPFSLPLALSRS